MKAYHFAVTYKSNVVAEFVINSPGRCFSEWLALNTICFYYPDVDDELRISFYGEVKVNPAKLPIDTVAILYIAIAQPNPCIPSYRVKSILAAFSDVSPRGTESLFDIES